MNRFELIIDINGVKHQLETNDDIPVSLNYNINDIRDISSVNSSYSKTIKIPDSEKNRLIFNDISDLNSSTFTFNPNKKCKAWVLADSIPVFDGYLQLKKAYVDKSRETGEFEVVIYADNDNFMKSIGDKLLVDLDNPTNGLDFSELDHYWNESNIVNSWTSEWNNGYYYPLIDYGQNWDLSEVNGQEKIIELPDSNPNI